MRISHWARAYIHRMGRRQISAFLAAAVCGAGSVAVACSAGGGADPAAGGGAWGRAIAVPGLAALDEGRHGRIMSLSCGSAGSCAAGGF